MVKETFVQEFCQILLKHNIITEKEIDSLSKAFKESEQEYFDDFLLEEGLIESADLLRGLSSYYKVPAIDVKGLFFENELLRKFPKEFLLQHSVIPYEVEDNMLFVISSRPEAEGLESAMREFVSYDVEFLVGISRDIQDAIEEFYDVAPTHDVEYEDMDIDEESRMRKSSAEKEEDLEELGYSEVSYEDDEQE